jgi:syntaxin 18
MDITPIFSQVLVTHDAQPVEPYVFRVEDLDEFLKEAYRIVGHVAHHKSKGSHGWLYQRTHVTKLHSDLRSIRQSYLSTAHPPRRKQYARPNGSATGADKDSKYLTDTERTEIDASAKQSLRELNHAINTLRDAEQIRQTTQTQVALRKRAKQGLGALGRWAAGGAITAKSVEEELEEAKANTIKAHRESIIWSLQNQLEECGRFQSSMMEIRLMREVEKSKSVLYKTRASGPAMTDFSGMNGSQSAGGSADHRGNTSHAQEESSSVIENQLDPEQLQLFAQENQDMLKQYEDQLDKVRYVLYHLKHPWQAF